MNFKPAKSELLRVVSSDIEMYEMLDDTTRTDFQIKVESNIPRGIYLNRPRGCRKCYMSKCRITILHIAPELL